MPVKNNNLKKLTNNSGFEVNKDGPGDVLSSPGLTKEGVERVISSADGFVARHLAVRLDAMLKTV